MSSIQIVSLGPSIPPLVLIYVHINGISRCCKTALPLPLAEGLEARSSLRHCDIKLISLQCKIINLASHGQQQLQTLTVTVCLPEVRCSIWCFGWVWNRSTPEHNIVGGWIESISVMPAASWLCRCLLLYFCPFSSSKCELQKLCCKRASRQSLLIVTPAT